MAPFLCITVTGYHFSLDMPFSESRSPGPCPWPRQGCPPWAWTHCILRVPNSHVVPNA